MKKVKWSLMIVLTLLVSGAKAETSFSILTNSNTDFLEGRIEFGDVNDPWSIGVLGKYFEDVDDSREDWAVGLYAKLAVDPNATFPIKEWLPEVGEWINLPESISAATYLIFKGELYPCENRADIVGSIGAGGEIGPVIVEYIYTIIESGDSGNPLQTSGTIFYFGLKPIKF